MNDAPNISKRSRLARNSVYGLLSWLLPAVPSLIVTPIVVHRLGNERYGLYAAILGITGYFFTLGVGRIAAKYVAEYTAAGDEHRAAQFLSAALIITIAATVVSLAILLAATPYLVDRVLRIDAALRTTAVNGVWLAGGVILFTAVAQVWQSALQGLHRFGVFLWLSNVTSLSLSIGLLIIVLAGGDVLGLLIWAAGNAFVTLVASVGATKYVWPAVRMTPRIRLTDWRSVLIYALSVIGYQFFGVTLLLFERGWVIREFGMANVAYYLVPMNLALLLLGFTGGALAAMFPALNERLNDTRVVADLYQRSSKFVVIVVALAIVGAVASGNTFLRLWLGPDFAEASSSLLIVHVVTFSITSLSLIWWQLAESFRKAPVTALANCAMMLITIPLMIVLGRANGLIGVALGRLIGLLPYVVLWIYVERSFVGGVAWRFWADLAKRLVIPVALAYTAMWACLMMLQTNWLTWALAVGIGSMLYFASLFVFGAFDRAEMAMLRELIFRKPADARL